MAGSQMMTHGKSHYQGLSQDLETGCLKLAIVKSFGVQIFKGITTYYYSNHKYV